MKSFSDMMFIPSKASMTFRSYNFQNESYEEHNQKRISKTYFKMADVKTWIKVSAILNKMLAATISFSKIRLRQNSEIKMAFNICTKLSKQPLAISHNRTNSKNLEYSEKMQILLGCKYK